MFCPVCGVEYFREGLNHSGFVGKYLQEQALEIKFDNLIDHSRTLAEIAHKSRLYPTTQNPDTWDDYSPMRSLLLALSNAKQFVHFISYGISDMFVGALKLTAQRVCVRGIVSNANERQIEELTEHRDEAPQLYVKTFGRVETVDGWDQTPHQKLVVIDGLIAFTGSANLTVSGWRKAGIGNEVVDVVTDLRDVARLNNRYFSKVWQTFSDVERIDIGMYV
jgi:phosphatidylserine/phosphatidylglycerophosphate/cardiolipin synthase-like enzyme